MQVSFSLWLQEEFENFQGVFDFLFAFFTMFGQELIFILIISVLYWTVNKRLSIIVSFSVLFSAGINGFLKELCKVDRPFENNNVTGIRYVEIKNFFVDTVSLKGTYSFPSGHAMWASSLFSALSLNFKKKHLTVFSIFIILLVCISRIYLGVHFLFDVVVGAILGLSIAYLVYLLFRKIENKEIFVYIFIILFGAFLLIFSKSADDFKGIGGILGFGFGAIFEKKLVSFNEKEGKLINKIFRVIIGLIILLLLKEGLKYVFNLIDEGNNYLHMLRYFTLVFFGFGVYPLIFKKLKL